MIMIDPGVKCSVCNECKREDCEWYCGPHGFHNEPVCYFEPDDYEEGDIGSASVAEMRRQNGDY